MTVIEDVMTVERIITNPTREIGLAWIENGSTVNSESKLNTKGQRHPKVYPVISEESLLPLLVEMIDSSREVVCVSSFLLQGSNFTDSLLRASSRGVRVYILTAGEEDLKVTDEDGSPSVQRVKEFRQLLSNFSDKVFLRTADFHAKFVIVDPDSNHSKGIMTTCNLTKDAMSGFNKELFVILSADEVYSFYCQFSIGVWEMSRHELRNGKLQELEENKFSPDVPIPHPTHPVTLPAQKVLYESIRKLLASAVKSVQISAWTFTDEVNIPNLLMGCLDRDVTVKIYTRPNYLNGVVLSKLQAKGAQVLAHERYHAKAIVVDGVRSIVTTANFAKHGLEDGFEAGVTLDEDGTKQLSAILAHWEKECNLILSQANKIDSLSGTVKIIDSEIQKVREVKVEYEKIINMPDLKLKEITQLGELTLNTDFQEPHSDIIYKNFRLRYRVFQSYMPKSVTKVDVSNEKFDIYKLESTKELFVPITQWEELIDAREVAIRRNAKVVKFAKG